MANLAQLKMLEDLDGFLLVDKPAGIAFSTVVKTVKRKYNLVKVGHGGSLDAAASGLLILLVNDANKFVGDVMGADRSYAGMMRLGVKTNTGDVQGVEVEKVKEVERVEDVREKIAAVLPEFKGDVFQTEPQFCAVRREGSASYDVADTGEHKPFLTHVYRFEVENGLGGSAVTRNQKSDTLSFSVSGTKNLIVRALVDDFGDALGCGAALESCRRTRIGKFSVEDAIPFDRLLETEIKDFASCVMPLSEALL